MFGNFGAIVAVAGIARGKWGTCGIHFPQLCRNDDMIIALLGFSRDAPSHASRFDRVGPRQAGKRSATLEKHVGREILEEVEAEGEKMAADVGAGINASEGEKD